MTWPSVIYDIFGFFPQTIQGADILALTDKEHPYQVFIPDFFDGKPADISWYPPDNDEKGAKLGEFFKTTAAPPKTLERIPEVIDELKKSKGVQEWGIVGFCWGGKIVNLSSFEGSLFKVAAAAHPAMVAGDDAKGVIIPYAMLPSKDEDKSEVEKWQQNIKTPNIVEWFPDQVSLIRRYILSCGCRLMAFQVHGWMAARGDLEQEKVKKEYERGYKLVLDFFHKHM